MTKLCQAQHNASSVLVNTKRFFGQRFNDSALDAERAYLYPFPLVDGNLEGTKTPSKFLYGRALVDGQGRPVAELQLSSGEEKRVGAVQAAALILSKAKAEAEHYLGEQV